MEDETELSSEIYTVSDINREVRSLLDECFPLVWVEGEISNCVKPRSGHLYFSLKDEYAQVRCAMFQARNGSLNFTPTDGMQVLVHAKVSLYEPRGDFQLIVYEMEERGDGKLRRLFEQLKKRLEQEGLFAEEHKQPLPLFPQCLGVITSPTGAAIRDVLTVLQRRFPSLPVIIYPTEVQGTAAVSQIVKAIQLANRRKECDVLLLTRGGGSLEDLWPFNEEIVARAIYASEIPLVSAIGHEIDFTISDFVADKRAPTPSAAAELISPNSEELLSTLIHWRARLIQLMQSQLRHCYLHFNSLKKRLQHPGQRLRQWAQQLDYLEQMLTRLMQHQLEQAKQRLILQAKTLNSVNPLNVLQRGYSILSKNKIIIRNANQVEVGDVVDAQLSDGSLMCRVEEIENK